VKKLKLVPLEKLRGRIDGIDFKILELLNRRTELAVEIGHLKAKGKGQTYVPDREKQIYDRLLANNKGLLSNESIKAIYREIMSGALSIEKPLKIAYLGPPATFTHIAALKKFGSSVTYVDCGNIKDVFAEVEKGRSDYGVVPIENSTEGAVDHTLDMFVESDLKICSEVLLDISHNLLAKCPLASIKKVYSNPQAVAQCRLWLESNLPRVELVEVSSTSRAAELASKEKWTSAIASKLAASIYGLDILASSIEDSAHNITRFLVIGRGIPKPTGRDRTSILFSIKDRVGALHDMLVPFKRHRINLTKIESRPSKKKAWDYYFFIDMEGHCENRHVVKALSELEKECRYLKILGSYPKEE